MGWGKNLRLYLWKNYLQRIRHPCAACCEICTPLVFVGLMALLYMISKLKVYDTSTFADQTLNQAMFPAALLPKKLWDSNMKLGMVAPDDVLTPLMDGLDVMYPGLNATKVFGAKYEHMSVPKFSQVVRVFPSEDDLTAHVTAKAYSDEEQIFGAIVINSGAPHWEYSLRMNMSDVPTTEEYTDDLQRKEDSSAQNKYFGITLDSNQLRALATQGAKGIQQVANAVMPGFVPLQLALDRYIINRTSATATNDQAEQLIYMIGYLNSTGPIPGPLELFEKRTELLELVKSAGYAPQQVTMTPFPIRGFKVNNFYAASDNVFSLFFMFCFMYPAFRLIWSFVHEKESRVREGVKMMGMTDSSLFTAWYITYAVIFLIISFAILLITKAGIFSNSNTLLVFLTFYLFCLSAIAFSFLISAFFSRSRTAAILGTVLFVVAFFPYFGVEGISTSTGGKLAASLLSPTAFGLAIKSMSAYEASGLGLTFGNLFNPVNKYSTGLGLVMMAADFVIYTILGWYIDKVWPSEFGVRQPLYFPCSRTYWCGRTVSAKERRRRSLLRRAQSDAGHRPLLGVAESKAEPGDAPSADSTPTGVDAHIEPATPQDRLLAADDRCISINHLTKRFTSGGGARLAVDGLNFNIYENEITCLLGHNGAGKTTTMNMLTGLLPITSGGASIYGLDVETEMREIRKNLGVCPQHDVLFNDLTVREHLVFFAGLKNVPKEKVKTAVSDIIAEVGLTEKVNVQAQALSGGQKRKLSLAIALIGGSKVVILDEPTSGMDPYSRRSTWSIIQNNREGRIILLTTHFMDEADLLGDRIAIMGDGKLRCLGSSIFLKEQYGVGYHLTVAKDDGCLPQAVVEVVKRHVPEAKVVSNVGAELSFQLPFSSAANFPDMFAYMDENKSRLALDTYGIGVTTLEEVFLSVAQHGNKKQQELTRQASARIRAASVLSSDMPGSPPVGARGAGAGAGLHASSELRSVAAAKEDPSASFDIERGGAGGDYRRSSASRNFFCRHFGALFLKRCKYTSRDKKAWVFQLVIPIAALLVGLALLKSATPTSLPAYTISGGQYNVGKEGRLPNFNIMPYNLSSNAAEALMGYVTTKQGEPKPVTVHLDEYLHHYPANLTDKDIEAMSYYLLNTIDDQKASRYGAYIINHANVAEGSATAELGYSVLQNTTALHSVPLYINIANDAAYRKSRGPSSASDVSITVINHPLPLTAKQRAIIATASAFFAVLLIAIAFAFVPASFVSFIVKEREVNAKHQQLISGVSIFAYWLSTFAWDIVNYLIPCGASLLIVYLFQLQELISADAFPATALLFFGYGTAVASFTYCMSYLFKSHSTAQNVVLVVNLLVFVLLLVSSIMSALENTCEANQTLRYFYRLLPGFALGSGLLHLATIQVLPFINTDCGKIPFSEAVTRVYKPFDAEVAGSDLWFLAAETVGYFLIAVLIDVLLSYPSVRAMVFRDTNIEDPPMEVDDDVAAEAERVKSGRADDDVILLHDLRKVYGGKKAAVRNLSFGIPKGQCFGFLGINGAGKTSTLKILSGDLIPTAGGAKLGGYDIMTQQPEVRRLLGYCPQFDALLDLLTVREHLELFARIKGVPSNLIDGVVSAKIRELQLDDFEHKYAGTLSGGNKRKLSVAIAMIGDPMLLFLDEPSTGMDPMARRFMWDVIARVSNQRKQCSIILTTHSMEECEALCTRVGIMVGGRLRCLGSVQHLKHRFGRGYMAEVTLTHPKAADVEDVVTRLGDLVSGDRLHRPSLNAACRKLGDVTQAAKVHMQGSGWLIAAQFEKAGSVAVSQFASWWVVEALASGLQRFLHDTFPGSELVERHDHLFRFRLPDTDLPLGEMFRMFEDNKEAIGISEYSMSQTSLEQIFNVFASTQEEETGVVRGMRSHSIASAAKQIGVAE